MFLDSTYKQYHTIFVFLCLTYLLSMINSNSIHVTANSIIPTSCEELTHWKRLWRWEGWGQEEKGRTTEDEMAGWHHWLDGRESEWTPGVGDGQGALACCDSWDRKESDTTEQLNQTELNLFYDWVVLHCIYVPYILYPFLCQRTFSLLPCLGCYKQCCSEHWDACIFSNYGFSPDTGPRVGLLDRMVALF